MSGMNERMQAAYRVAAAIERERGGAPLDLADDEIVCVTGTYDRVQDVLRLAELPHRAIEPGELDVRDLRPEQFLVINCASMPLMDQAQALREWTAEGGTLMTTDWAVDLTAACFPGVIRRVPGVTTADEVVPVEVVDNTSPVTRGLFLDGETPRWWLEGSSYPFEVTEGVQVLVRSDDMRARYGSGLVAVAFHWYRGMVLHMVSHFYLQRAELRTAKDAAGSKSFVEAALGSTVSEKLYASAPAMAAVMDSTATGEVRAAYTNYSMAAGMVRAKKETWNAKSAAPPPRPRPAKDVPSGDAYAVSRAAGYTPAQWRR